MLLKVLWTSIQTTTTDAAHPSLKIRIVEASDSLSGCVHDPQNGVDVLVASGSIDDQGKIQMTVVLSNQNTLGQVLIFKGRVASTGARRQMVGTYMGLNPCERGTFSMTPDSRCH